MLHYRFENFTYIFNVTFHCDHSNALHRVVENLINSVVQHTKSIPAATVHQILFLVKRPLNRCAHFSLAVTPDRT